MNLWSLARVEVVSLGDGAHPAGVGALRRVHVPSRLRPLALDEVVVEAEPPHRFAYRVVAGVPVRRHLGRLACEPSERGTRLRWEVDIEPPNRLLGLLIRRSLVPQLERSLDRMVRAAGDADAGTALPPRRDLDEHAPVPDLLRVAEDCLAE
ncbi:MAG: SRPBCC family protein, partial [Myxococcota bacterium]